LVVRVVRYPWGVVVEMQLPSTRGGGAVFFWNSP